MKKIIGFIILIWPLCVGAQQVIVDPIPLEPPITKNEHNQVKQALETARQQLQITQDELKTEKEKRAELQTKLESAQKALKKSQKSLNHANDQITELTDKQTKANRKIKQLQAEILSLENRLANYQPTPTPMPTTAPRAKVTYPRRSEPKTVSDNDRIRFFNLDQNYRPKQYVPVTSGRFEKIKNGQVVKDNATGLMWQQGGSPNYMTYEDARRYIQKLNDKRFAGYSDWRLPTVDELTSLLTPQKQNGNLYISSVFDPTQRWCWSSDRAPSGAWLVDFVGGRVSWNGLAGTYLCVRAVRSGQ